MYTLKKKKVNIIFNRFFFFLNGGVDRLRVSRYTRQNNCNRSFKRNPNVETGVLKREKFNTKLQKSQSRRLRFLLSMENIQFVNDTSI